MFNVCYSMLSQKFNFVKTQYSRTCNFANIVDLCNYNVIFFSSCKKDR